MIFFEVVVNGFIMHGRNLCLLTSEIKIYYDVVFYNDITHNKNFIHFNLLCSK